MNPTSSLVFPFSYRKLLKVKKENLQVCSQLFEVRKVFYEVGKVDNEVRKVFFAGEIGFYYLQKVLCEVGKVVYYLHKVFSRVGRNVSHPHEVLCYLYNSLFLLSRVHCLQNRLPLLEKTIDLSIFELLTLQNQPF